MLEKLTIDNFSQLEGKTFKISEQSGGACLSADLIEVKSLRKEEQGADDKREPFSIIFRGPNEPVLAQGIHKLEQEDFGQVELFLVPIGPDATGMCYEAVFN